MKKIKNKKPLDLMLFFILGIGVGIAFGMSSALLLCHNKKEKAMEYKYELVPLSNCDEGAKLYYQEKDRNVYLYCLNSIKVKEDGNVLELKNYVKGQSNGIDNTLEEMTIVSQYDDGGSTLYKDLGDLSENGFAVLKCSTLMGSKDIYIGPKDMKYEDGFCEVEKKEIVKEFTRTYQVLNIEASNEENYSYITVKSFQNEEMATVKVISSLISNVQIGKNYEFHFSYTEKMEDTIPSIFTNATLLSINETDKVGLEQIQDSI